MAKKTSKPAHVLVGICGASGLLYARRTLEILHAAPGVYVHAVVSAAARTVAAAECHDLPEWEKRSLRYVCPPSLLLVEGLL